MPEIYNGIKFNECRIGKGSVTHPSLDALILWCKTFSDRGYAPEYPGGSSGNLSFRVQNDLNTFIITGSFTNLGGNLSSIDFVEVIDCDQTNNLITYNGIKSPSSESLMHYLLYKNKPEIQAVFHGHSEVIMTKAVALGYPMTKMEAPYGTLDLAIQVFEAFDDRGLIIIKNHGFVSIGSTLQEAGNKVLNL
jgi:L-fuculose-phosphate aldolase